MSVRRHFAYPFAAALGLAISGFSAPASAVLLFQEVPNPYGTQLCSGNKLGCWTNYLRMTDIDGDGDLDILLPNADGYFQKGSAQPFAVYLNDGLGAFTNGSAAVVGGYTGYVRQIAVGDVDGDGDLDLYIPAAWGDADVLRLNDNGTFVDHSATHLPNLHSHAGAARFADVDSDGDLDLFVGDGWAQNATVAAHLYLNDGTGHFTDATADVPQGAPQDGPIDFDLLDADGDFDLDILIDLHGSKSLLWINDGLGHFTNAAGFPSQSGLHYGPVACDVDGDGDLDIWVDNSGPNYTEQLLINDGAGHYTDETAARVTGNPGADDNGVACVDVDGDGDMDAVIAALSNNERTLINDGTGHFTLSAGTFPNVGDSTLWFDFGDVNGDGRIDVATGQGEGSFIDRLYFGTAAVPVDVLAPKIRALESVPGPVGDTATPLVRFGIVDESTTDEGPRLQKAWIRVTTTAGTTDVTATFMGGDLFRAVLPAQADGTMVTYAGCAKDRKGNEGCGTEKTYLVSAGATTSSSSSAASGTGGSSTSSTGGAGASGPASGAGGHGGGAGGHGGGDGGSGGDLQLEDEPGCGCSVPGSAEGEWIGGAVMLGLFGISRARRRRR